MQTVQERLTESLLKILNQKLDVYDLEVISCIALEGIDYNTVNETKDRVERFLESLNKTLSNWE